MVQLDKARPLYGCLTQNHLQLDTLNFDLQNLMVKMFVSDLSCTAVHMVCLVMFIVCSLIFESYVISHCSIGTGASLASSARRVQGKICRQMDLVTYQGCGHSGILFKMVW